MILQIELLYKNDTGTLVNTMQQWQIQDKFTILFFIFLVHTNASQVSFFLLAL